MAEQMTEETEEAVNYYAEKEAEGQIFEIQLTEADDTREKVLHCPTGRVIPIVYVHGMLSAALKAKGQQGVEDGANVWKAPPTLLSGAGAILGSLEFFGYNAAKHQIRLDPKTTEVDYDGAFKWWYDSVKKKTAKLRGWGAVWQMGEQPFLDRLQGSLDNLKKIKLKEISKKKKEFDWYALLNTDPAQYGGVNYMAAEQVTLKELETMQKYQFDVWVAAYNWLDAHKKQAKDVIMKRIKEDILGHYKGSADAPEKVIIITHSLGGLASRTFTQLTEGADNLVWGVNHSCQPAEGAATAYHHVRCGYDGVSGKIFGQGTNYVTPLMANGPGVMALLPFPTYQNSEPWLFIHQPDEITRGKKFLALPQQADGQDIYKKVYQSDAWYGVLPKASQEYTTKLLNPAGLEHKDQVVTAEMFYEAIDRIKDFQADLHEGGYYKMTFAHAESQDGKSSKTWNHGQWEVLPSAVHSSFNNLLTAEIEHNGYDADDKTNQLRLSDQSVTHFLPYKKEAGWANAYDFNVTNYDLDSDTMLSSPVKVSDQLVKDQKSLWWSGDGTVAAASGEAPFIADVKGGYFIHGNRPVHQKLHEELRSERLQKVVEESKSPKEKPLIPFFNLADYEHASALGDDLPYYSTLHAIVKIVANVVDKELGG